VASLLGAVLVVLAAGAAVSTAFALEAGRKAARAEEALAAQTQARRQTRAALDEMSSQVIEDWLSRQAQLEPAQRAFLEKALGYYEAFAAESGNTEEARRGVADAYHRVGKIRRKLGQHPEAEAAFRRALELYAGLAADFPDQPRHRQELALASLDLGNLFSDMGRPREREAAYREALALQEKLAADFPDAAPYRRDLAQTHNNLGNLLKETGRPREAGAAYADARALQRRLAADFPGVPLYRQDLARCSNNLGALLRDTGRPREAEAAFRDAVALQKPLAADFPDVPAYRVELARSHHNLGVVLSVTGRPREAEAAFREARSVQQALAADFPTVPQYRQDLAQTHVNLGVLQKDAGRPREAETSYREALDIQRRLAGDFPAVPHRAELGNTLDRLAELARGRKDHAAACRLLDEARPHLQAALDANPRHPYYRVAFCQNRHLLAATLVDLGEHGRAAEAAADLARVAFYPVEDSYNAACFLSGCIPLAEHDALLPESRRKELAKDYGDRAVEALRQAIANGFKDAANMQKDTDLDPLRGRPDFRKLLDGLKPAGR
jgi:tetratricopeptide (TPR) repeat protein